MCFSVKQQFVCGLLFDTPNLQLVKFLCLSQACSRGRWESGAHTPLPRNVWQWGPKKAHYEILRPYELTSEMAQTPSTSNNDASFVHTKSLIETEPVKNLSDAHSKYFQWLIGFYDGNLIFNYSTSLTLITSKPTRKEIVRKLNELLNELQSANGETLIRRKGEELKNHLLDYPASKMVVIEVCIVIFYRIEKTLIEWGCHKIS